MTERLKIFLSSILFVFLCSCAVAPPAITEIDWQIKLVKDLELGITYEALSFFVSIVDDDGVNDIEVIYLIEDKTQYIWKLTPENWIMNQNDYNWYGSNSIVMADRSPIPRTKYRVFVRDRAGENTEDNIFVTRKPLDPDSYTFPELKVEEDKFSVLNFEEVHIMGVVGNSQETFYGKLTNEPRDFSSIFSSVKPEDSTIKYYLLVRAQDGQALESGPFIMNDDSE